jgi:hypothetical protein
MLLKYFFENHDLIYNFSSKFDFIPGIKQEIILIGNFSGLIFNSQIMNFSDFIANSGRRIRKEHFIQLVKVAKIDGKISKSELVLLHKEGKKFGLTDPEIDNLLKLKDPYEYNPPYSLRDKFDELYEIAEMILADNVITEGEKKMIKKYAIAAGFSDPAIDKLIPLLLEGIKMNKDSEKLFNEFKKKHFFK